MFLKQICYQQTDIYLSNLLSLLFATNFLFFRTPVQKSYTDVFSTFFEWKAWKPNVYTKEEKT